MRKYSRCGGTLDLVPHLRVVALDDLLERQRGRLAAQLHVVGLPRHRRLRADRGAGPDDVEVGEVPLGGQAEADLANAELVAQPGDEVGEALHERVAVHLEPDGLVDRLQLRRHREPSLDAPACGGDEVGAPHVLERPLGAHRVRELRHRAVEAGRERACLVADDVEEALPRERVHVRERVDGLHGRADAGERGPRALRQRLQQQVAPPARLDAARDVVEHEHEARDAAFGGLAPPSRKHGRHLHAHQLPARRGGDEVRGRSRLPALQALVDVVQRVDDEVAVEDREHRAPQPDQRHRLAAGGAVERLAQELHRARVVEQDAAFDVAHDDALGKLRHQRRQPAPLLLDACVRLAHPLLDVRGQRLAHLREAVEHAGERAQLRGAAGGRAVRRIGAEHDLGVAGELPRGGDVAAEQRVQADPDGGKEQDRRDREPGRPVANEVEQRLAFGAGKIGAQQEERRHDRGEQQPPRRGDREGEAQDRRHGGASAGHGRSYSPSICCTRATSSLVEKGLVT